MIGDFVGDWHWLAFRGAVALLFGLTALAWPGVTLWALVVLWGAFALADGIFALGSAILGDVETDRGWRAFLGVTGIGAGIVTFVWPAITALALLFVIAAWAFLIGLAQLTTAIRLRKEIDHEWLLGAAGLLAIAFAVLLVITPGEGALAITWAIGWFATLWGVIVLLLAGEVHHETRTPHRSDRAPARGTPHPAM